MNFSLLSRSKLTTNDSSIDQGASKKTTELDTKIASDQCLLNQLANAQDEYYKNTTKNVFLKKQQKFDCAVAVTQQFDVTKLIENSVFVIPDSNCIYMDYPVFKMYAHPDNYSLIVDRFICIINGLIAQYGSFKMHLNMNSFTVSAAERYLPLIKLFCTECAKDTSFSRAEKMEQLFTYYTPIVISNIVPMIMKVSEKCLRKKLTHYNKEESGKLIEKLLNSI